MVIPIMATDMADMASEGGEVITGDITAADADAVGKLFSLNLP
jgi:hypothetical protein